MSLDRIVNRAVATSRRGIDDHCDAGIVNGRLAGDNGLGHRGHADEISPVSLQSVDLGRRFESRPLHGRVHTAVVAGYAGACGRLRATRRDSLDKDIDQHLLTMTELYMYSCSIDSMLYRYVCTSTSHSEESVQYMYPRYRGTHPLDPRSRQPGMLEYRTVDRFAFLRCFTPP